MKRTTSRTARNQPEMGFAAETFALTGETLRNLDGVKLAALGDQTAPAAELLPARDLEAKRTQEARAWFADDSRDMPAHDPREGSDFSGGFFF